MHDPNKALIGQAMDDRFQTPALLLDLDAFQRNVGRMADKVRVAGRTLRPHVKSHKCVEIARRQIEVGAIGLCCASIHEVEVMAEADFDGILLTAPVVTKASAARVVAARENVPSLMVVVDSEAGLGALADVATAQKPLDVLVEIDVGQTRTGVTEPVEAVRLARLAATSDVPRYRGIQAYYGNLQHVPDLRRASGEDCRAMDEDHPHRLGASSGGSRAQDCQRWRHRHASQRFGRGPVYRDSGGILHLHGSAVFGCGVGSGQPAV